MNLSMKLRLDSLPDGDPGSVTRGALEVEADEPCTCESVTVGPLSATAADRVFEQRGERWTPAARSFPFEIPAGGTVWSVAAALEVFPDGAGVPLRVEAAAAGHARAARTPRMKAFVLGVLSLSLVIAAVLVIGSATRYRDTDSWAVGAAVAFILAVVAICFSRWARGQLRTMRRWLWPGPRSLAAPGGRLEPGQSREVALELYPFFPFGDLGEVTIHTTRSAAPGQECEAHRASGGASEGDETTQLAARCTRLPGPPTPAPAPPISLRVSLAPAAGRPVRIDFNVEAAADSEGEHPFREAQGPGPGAEPLIRPRPRGAAQETSRARSGLLWVARLRLPTMLPALAAIAAGGWLLADVLPASGGDHLTGKAAVIAALIGVGGILLSLARRAMVGGALAAVAGAALVLKPFNAPVRHLDPDGVARAFSLTSETHIYWYFPGGILLALGLALVTWPWLTRPR